MATVYYPAIIERARKGYADHTSKAGIYLSKTGHTGEGRYPGAACLRGIRLIKPDRLGQAESPGLDSGFRRNDRCFLGDESYPLSARGLYDHFSI